MSAPGCPFIGGTVGAHVCTCTDKRKCLKAGKKVLCLTPHCFSYHVAGINYVKGTYYKQYPK